MPHIKYATNCPQKLLLLLLLSTISGCIERKTQNPIEAYTFWSGQTPSNDVKVLHGSYWQSSHWSTEYITYLHLKASPNWREEFIKRNDLIETTNIIVLPSDAPQCFKAGKHYRTWTNRQFSQGSVYYEDTLKGDFLIYEIQL